ncbi:hypothetical protein P7K49_012770 [Saguinus oedipus]|uniref:Uncharacterized protein n=1 Tax=Saguinus oedipus TaxID=9490 RepID=A0ABQ9VEL9_SAGOE|nr:hypothetical protein P7K49_012770 [Saguinus oedipus]
MPGHMLQAAVWWQEKRKRGKLGVPPASPPFAARTFQLWEGKQLQVMTTTTNQSVTAEYCPRDNDVVFTPKWEDTRKVLVSTPENNQYVARVENRVSAYGQSAAQ